MCVNHFQTSNYYLRISSKCKVIEYRHENYRVQVFTKENKLTMPVQVPEERIKGTNPEENFIHDKLELLLKIWINTNKSF
jgi:hypothetical protein